MKEFVVSGYVCIETHIKARTPEETLKKYREAMVEYNIDYIKRRMDVYSIGEPSTVEDTNGNLLIDCLS